VKILFASDVSFNNLGDFKGTETANNAMVQVRPYFDNADFSMLNLENIFDCGNKYLPIIKSGPNLISSSDYIAYIDALNPTTIGLANNHAGDYGEEALLDTLNLLEQKGYSYVGAGENIDASYKPKHFEKDVDKISVIAVCENEFGTATETSAGSAGFNMNRLINLILYEKANGYLPIVYFHGGNEFCPTPSPDKTELYRLFIDVGASAVIAMHTHCPQGYEIYKDKPIVYSMGNFYFPKENKEINWYYGYMSKLEIDKGNVKLDIIPYKLESEVLQILVSDELNKFNEYMTVLNEIIANPEKQKELFRAWCIISGANIYAQNLNYSDEMLQDNKKLVHVKNIFSCEAHNELIKTLFNMSYDGYKEEAVKAAEKIKALQNFLTDD